MRRLATMVATLLAPILVTLVTSALSAIALTVVIPPMIVHDGAALALPSSLVVPPTDVVRRHPIRARVRRPCPVPVMPGVMTPGGIPVALHKGEVGTRLRRDDVDARGRRDANPDTHGDLCAEPLSPGSTPGRTS